MIIFGGCTAVFTPQQSTYEPCPTARSLLSQDHNRYLQYEDQYLNDMFVFDTASLKWTKINYRNKASGRKSIDDVVVKIPAPRAGHTFTLVNSYFYLFGGYGGGVHHDDLWMFSPVTLSWVQIIPKSSASNTNDSNSNNQSGLSSSTSSSSVSSGSLTAPLGRSGHSAFSVGNYLIIYGGYSAGIVFKDLWAFDTVKLTWKFVNVESLLPPQYHDSFFLFSCIYLLLLLYVAAHFTSPSARCNQVCFPVLSSTLPSLSLPSTKISFFVYGGISYESTVPRSDMWVCVFSQTRLSGESDLQPFPTEDDVISETTPSDSSLPEVSMAVLLEDEEAEFIFNETKKVREKVDENLAIVNNIDKICSELREKINKERTKIMEKLLKEDETFSIIKL
jgi:hypothetical protein